MAVLSLRLEEEDLKLVKEYTKINNINMSSFVRSLILDKIYDDIDEVEEKRIYKVWQDSKNQKKYSAESVFEELGI
ncbi:DUF6290 family protein [Oceanivirga miroungae]|uniref:Toxin-antitoxin system, antitoxin component, ribbon-helix-helix domain protein n=1 Tax=Oceanivirga miroungae TaxID=1130046 RepID=A0A6I8MFP5_9FUSO|nr:DUF6290 family protein [Oceanivirga miroungae]VWL89644.1 hypothetical protein OMES3154_01285 [Oceanivirga miroungae]